MGDELQRQALARDVARRLSIAPLDEVRLVDRVLVRLELGRERYGALDLSKPRDWRKERFEERLDALIYDACEELALEDAARAELREAARVEMVGGDPRVAELQRQLNEHVRAIDANLAAREFEAGEVTRASVVPARLALADDPAPYADVELGGEG